MKLLNGCVAVLLLGSTVQAADLREMQEMALANREVIQRYVTNVAKSDNDVTLARGGFYPALDLVYTANSLDEPSLTEPEENSVAVGRISWNLFAGFQDRYNLSSAHQLQIVENHRLQGIRQDVQLNVALSYLNVYDRLANLKVAESAYKTLEKVYRDGENKYEVGLIGKNELLRFRVDYDNADITMKAARAGLDKSVNSLSRQIGVEVGMDELDFRDFDELPRLLDEAEYERRMLQSRSEIKVLEGLIEAADSQRVAAYGDYYPRVDLVGSYSHYDDDYINGNGDLSEEELRGQLVVSMNLFRGFTTQSAAAKAKLETRGLRYDLQEVKDGLTTNLHNLFIDYRVSLENFEVANRSIEQAEENLRITQLKYDEGLEQESDLLDAITSLSRAKYNQVAVIRTIFANYFQLTRMIGGF